MASSFVDKFNDGIIVLRILNADTGKQKGIVITHEDYERKLHTHYYNPIIHLSNFKLKIAYLFDCLNRKYCVQRFCFIFQYRYIGKDTWIDWFKVNKYIENDYKNIKPIEIL